jgi:hypothetical protein
MPDAETTRIVEGPACLAMERFALRTSAGWLGCIARLKHSSQHDERQLFARGPRSRKPAFQQVGQSAAPSKTTQTATSKTTRRSIQRLITDRIPPPPNKGILNAHFCRNFGPR